MVICRAAVVIEWADRKLFTYTITINTADTCASAAQCAIFGCEARLMSQSGCVRWGHAGLGGRRQRSMRDKPVRHTHTHTHARACKHFRRTFIGTMQIVALTSQITPNPDRDLNLKLSEAICMLLSCLLCSSILLYHSSASLKNLNVHLKRRIITHKCQTQGLRAGSGPRMAFIWPAR